MNTNKFLILLLTVLTLSNCKDNKTQNQVTEETNPVTETETAPKTSSLNVSGNYVTEDYNKRGEGYDWVAVLVNQINENAIKVKVRSRADKKKPTCTFDTRADKKSDGVYAANVSGKTVLFTFTDGNLNIGTENAADEAAL